MKSGPLYIIALLAMTFLGVASVILLTIFNPGVDNTQTIVQISGILIPTTAVLMNLIKTNEVEQKADITKAKTEASNVILEEGARRIQESQNDIKELKISVDGRLSQLVQEIEKSSLVSSELALQEGIKKGREEIVTEATTVLAEARTLAKEVIMEARETAKGVILEALTAEKISLKDEVKIEVKEGVKEIIHEEIKGAVEAVKEGVKEVVKGS